VTTSVGLFEVRARDVNHAQDARRSISQTFHLRYRDVLQTLKHGNNSLRRRMTVTGQQMNKRVEYCQAYSQSIRHTHIERYEYKDQ